MDNEELYDSLEDEFSSASSTSVTLIKLDLEPKASGGSSNDLVRKNSSSHLNWKVIKEPPRKSSPKTLQQNLVSNLESKFKSNWNIDSETDEENCDISAIVPLYGGDKNKSEVETFKQSSSSSLLNRKISENLTSQDNDVPTKNNSNRRKKRSIFTSHKDVTGSCSNVEAIVQNRHVKSYLDMFHARIGYPGGFKEKQMEDTTRSIFGDSQRSLISDTSTTENNACKDASGDDSDSSFYFTQIEANRKKCESTFELNNNQTPPAVSSIPPSKLNSLSELFSTANSNKSLQKRKPRCRRNNFNSVPVLGSLGPDTTASQEKLERRKKQLSYGQKASNRNRIKMMEIAALKKLKNEIQKSNQN